MSAQQNRFDSLRALAHQHIASGHIYPDEESLYRQTHDRAESAYIAAATPTTILALLDALDAAGTPVASDGSLDRLAKALMEWEPSIKSIEHARADVQGILDLARLSETASDGSLDVERLARALKPGHDFVHDGGLDDCQFADDDAAIEAATRIAAEYARLSESPSEGKTE